MQTYKKVLCNARYLVKKYSRMGMYGSNTIYSGKILVENLMLPLQISSEFAFTFVSRGHKRLQTINYLT